jgi:hypothetical protein
MHAVTPRQYFPNIKLTWSIQKWPTLNAGSRSSVAWQHDILKFFVQNCKIVERFVLLTIQQYISEIYTVGILFCILWALI